MTQLPAFRVPHVTRPGYNSWIASGTIYEGYAYAPFSDGYDPVFASSEWRHRRRSNTVAAAAKHYFM
jgi:hypothetical protein